MTAAAQTNTNKEPTMPDGYDYTALTEIWSQTHSGREWNLLHPERNEVFWPDVAHHLSHLCRFTGATNIFYSVAEHCCHTHDELARENADRDVQLWGLLHDAHEAVIGDIATPVAMALDEVCPERFMVRAALDELKHRADKALWAATGKEPLYADARAAVKAVDTALLMQERDFFLAPPARPWGPLEDVARAKARLAGWPPAVARWEWLQRLRSHGVGL